MAEKRRVRVSVVIHSITLPAWQYTLLEMLLDASYAEVVLVLVAPGAEPSSDRVEARGGLLGRALSALHATIDARFARDPDALIGIDAALLLEHVPRLHITPTPDGRADAAARERVAAAEPDVILSLCASVSMNDLSGHARMGAWALYAGSAASETSPPAFWEVYRRSPIIESGVNVYLPGHERPMTAYRSISSVEDISVRLTRINLYWKSLYFAPRLLKRLHRCGSERFKATLETAAAASTPHRTPTAGQMASHVVRTTVRRARNLAQRVMQANRWIVLYRFADRLGGDMTSFIKLIPPRGIEWADPLVFVHEGKRYVFLEEYIRSNSKAHLSVLAVDSEGRFGPVEEVLNRPYHLSYPFVFEHDGSIYMVPETYENRTIELYRCVQFPHRWELAEVLMRDIHAVDATLHFQDGMWWMFVGVAEHAGASTWEELCVYFSDRLVHGTWTPHPENPVVSDVRRARPAGALFTEGNRLFRPSQDCSIRYGYAIKINEIKRLTPTAYEEHEIGSIEPDWDARLKGVHTLNHAGGLTVIDALQPRWRPLPS